MAKFQVIPGGVPEDVPAERVRKRVRQSRHKALPQCARCGGREVIQTRIGATKQDICVCCLLKGERIVVT